ncbi:unnamed protein product [Cyprideis torosa]|uniref:MHD domain-containing protein n=1 Tax=Cyprideis torosa TaxID=163714 RepID=A0A7R8ZQ56_9CRUS|nr:unnamed protein product [Cyprideis torosa]CAG0900563.1 unnamed protein product [Cyprideis torosa]
MINSLFITNSQGDTFMEKHWKSVIPRAVIDYLLDALKKASGPEDVPPVITTPSSGYLFPVLRNGLFFVAVCTQEVPPLFVIEFLHRVIDTFEDYFSDCTESVIKEHYVIVYELLDEMLDNGFPLATENNILKELIRPPNVFRTLANTVTGKSNMSSTLPMGSLSSVPWRRSGVKYTNNEAYFDVIEELDAVIDRNGGLIKAEITGKIESCVKLSGMPDLTMTFVNPRLMDDISFHPCIRHRRWEQERVLSFVPPDGNFCLIEYHVHAPTAVCLPITVRHALQFREGTSGRIELTLIPRNTGGRPIEGVKASIQMPKEVANCTVVPTLGKATFDPSSRQLCWDVGKVEVGKSTTLRGSISLIQGSPVPTVNPLVELTFTIPQVTLSGLRVSRLDMFGESYKPFKGVKYVSKAGTYQIRT